MTLKSASGTICPQINIFDEHAHLNDEVPEDYRGLERFEARRRVVTEIEALGLLEKIDEHTLQVPYGDRSDVVIEPWLTDQWYVDAETLAKQAITAVEDGTTAFVPKNWEKTYFEWMRNIQPWCVSRQLWWGHQIPAWYGPDGEVFVAYTEDEARAEAEKTLGAGVALTRDDDVLDTWFSSALWPFSTLGWPDETEELKRYYPTSVLVTGFDIIFFWVARMMMQGLHFMDEKPFDTVYVHALVRDAQGQKMSKSKGNIIDPLELIGEFGADALRFTLTAMAAQGRDIKLSGERVAGYRNFGTKLWNAARFCEMNECNPVDGFDPASAQEPVNRWIAAELKQAAATVAQGIEAFKFDEAAGGIYRFVWNIFCDWYLEFAKPLLNGEDEAAKAETRAMAAYVLDQILKVLHPVMPFLTEELWQQIGMRTGGRDQLLILTRWPELAYETDETARSEMDWVIRLVSEIRSVRSEMNVPAGAQVPLMIKDAAAATQQAAQKHAPLIERLARVKDISFTDTDVKGAIQTVVDEAVLFLPLAGIMDLDAERARLEKEIDKLDGLVKRIDGKLANEKFTANAPAEVVEKEREKKDDLLRTREKLADALTRLSSAA